MNQTAELAYLKAALPEDWAQYPTTFFETCAAHARWLREHVPWCRALPEEAYFQYVVCPRVNDEALLPHRKRFFSLLWDRVRGKSEAEAVLEVNRWCHEHASYEPQDARTAAPITVFSCGSGRCGEESAFLVAALRSVGLAARQVYVPRWSHCDDNHAWVEALCEGQWHFLGACEPECTLDRGWFQTAASRAILVHSRTFGPAEDEALHGEALGLDGQARLHNQTARYAKTKRCTFFAAPRETITLEVFNEARFCPIAALPAGDDGRVTVELGLGDLHLTAGDKEAFFHGETESTAVLHTPTPKPGWHPFSFDAPQGRETAAPLSPAQRQAREAMLAHGDAIRKRRIAGMFDARRAAAHPACAALLQKARGNFDTLCTFLEESPDPLRAALLGTLSEKDLRDVPLSVLDFHLRRARPWQGKFPKAVFERALLCPRIENEPLSDWSRPLPGTLGKVASLRKQGTPAYLRALDGAVMVWDGEGFRPLSPEQTGRVRFQKAPDARLSFRQNWSLSYWDGAAWRERMLSDDWQENVFETELPAGRYRVLLSARLPGGGQLAKRCLFDVREGETDSLPLELPQVHLKDLLFSRALPLPELVPPPGKPALLCWLEEGAEPTEHVLRECLAALPALRALPVTVRVFVRGKTALKQPTLAAVLAAWDGISVETAGWAYTAACTARHLGLEPERFPLLVACGRDGRAAYASAGYEVGAVDLLRRILEFLCGQSTEK